MYLQRPPSTSKGTSRITYFSPLHHALKTCLAISHRTAGCTIAFSCFRFFSSLKMIEPSFFLSNDPSSRRISSPNTLTILARAGVPGATTARAMMSASMRGVGGVVDRRRVDTVDLPVEIPPVKPMTILPVSKSSSLWNVERRYRASWFS